uniref:polycystin-1-like protein 1 n=1 Tax=Doryrhamphus excisus TaxID=161450 RepID=UPI0025AE2B8E
HNCLAVSIYAASQACPTDVDVTFLAVGDVPEPVEFLWNFGDSTTVRSTTRNVTKRYKTPARYNITVIMSDGGTSLAFGAFPLLVQRPVKLNKLVHRASVLQNHTATVTCRVTAGTDVAFSWSFGDGTRRIGQSTEGHIFRRTGEFQLEVTVSNRVSSASLRGVIFVVKQPCQPPPVKNMGPRKLQVRRHEVVRLGVTYEDEVDCEESKGLRYTWTLVDSAGHILPLADAHKQSLVLPGHFLHYGTYTAIARVQVVGSVVYSNYSVRVQVMPSTPVAAIHGGTNIFINRNVTMVTLDGWKSYDPDFPTNPISVKWMCEPVSAMKSSCFDHDVVTSSTVLSFPVSFLKNNFDQYRFTLTVHSGERSASSEIFVTLTPNVIGKVTVSCLLCEGDQVNLDESFSVKALCEDCGVAPNHIQYTWTLFLVNAASKSAVEVPFCYTVDLGAPSPIMQTTSSDPVGSGEEPSNHPRGELSLIKPSNSSTEQLLLVLDDGSIHLDVGSEFPIDYDSSADWEFPAIESAGQDYDVPFKMAEEGDPGISAGRPTGMNGEALNAGDDSSSHDPKGSNLMDYSSSRQTIREPTLLDLPRDPVEAGLFASYTYTGLSSPLLSFRPFSLRSGSRYMLEVIAKSQSSILGRTQLFLRTKPIPKGMTCQVQPSKGLELYTHFSIFCTSGREDLVYEYSFSIGSKPPRLLYQGRNFQYYFNLPSGHLSDDYKVTIYTKIRSSTYGSSTRVCPATVQVLPSFFRDISSDDPDVELSQSGLKNLSALVLLGNNAEIRNYVSLLSGILNRLSSDSQTGERWQRRMRSVLICTLCKLESNDQDSMVDSICILRDLLQVTRQVTLASVRQVAAHVGAIARQLSHPSATIGYRLDEHTLRTLVTLLAYSLEAADVDVTHELESDLEAIRDSFSGDVQPRTRVEQQEQIVDNILQTASDLILKHVVFSKIQEYRISVGVMSLYVTRQHSSVMTSGSAVFHIPAPLLQSLRGDCVLSLVAEFTHSPWTWAHYPGRIKGPVLDLTLYKCSTRRKISIRSLVHPIITELKTTKNKDSAGEFILLRNHINYHSFNITQEYLQRAIQLSVVFTLPPNRTFPIMLLYRMFAKPTPSMHHLRSVHQWETNTTRITLPPSYLNAPGVGYLALLDVDFAKPVRHKHISSHVKYTLAVDASQCLSLDQQKRAWTSLGCRTHQADGTVSCSCHHLRALTVTQQLIQSSHDTARLDPFISEAFDATVLVVLVLCVCLYVPAWVQCRRADITSEQTRRVHYLSDNTPTDPHFYAVTIHTGLGSAHRMSAKVYIVLYGGDGTSQTRELHVPGCTLFRRNSQDTFIISAAESLGPVWGVHIWHDNSGPSPHFYLKLVEVSEVSRADGKKRTWVFISQCWLSVSNGDGHVERMLRVCTQSIGFTQMLVLKLCDYMADFHMWTSLYSCPWPHAFTHTQRLSVCLLLFTSYACISALITSQMDEPLYYTTGITSVSAVSVTTGVLAVVVALPVATLITVLFRKGTLLMEEEGTQLDYKFHEDDTEAFKKHQDAKQTATRDIKNQKDLSKDNKATIRNIGVFHNRKGRKVAYVAWLLCLLLSLVCLLLSAVLGLRFSTSKVQLWIHSLFFSLLSCIFLIQPLVIISIALIVSLWNRKRSTDFLSRATSTEIDRFKVKKQNISASSLTKLLEQRQRARFLRLVRPPAAAELRRARGQRRREAFVHKTIRDLCVLVAMLLLMLCISSGSSFNYHYRLNKAVRQRFTCDGFMSIQTNEDWWRWTQSILLNLLYTNAATKADFIPQSHMIGEPIVWKKEICRSNQCSERVSTSSLYCGAVVGLGKTKYDATDRLKALRSHGDVALKLQFTLYSPVPDLFTTVTLLAEKNPIGSLLPSVEVHSVKVYNTPSVWDYVTAFCQVLFLCLSLMHLCFQVCTAWQQGMMGYCTAPCNWLDMTLQIVVFVYYYLVIDRSVAVMDVVELLQRNSSKAHVDVRPLAVRAQYIRSLLGVVVFLLTLKCATMVRLNSRSAAVSFWTLPNFFLPTMSCFILLVVACSFHSRDYRFIGGLLCSGPFVNYRALWLISTAVMMAVSSGSKRCQSRAEACTLAELSDYIRRRVCGREAMSSEESKTYYLEECEGLVDELLLKLNNLHCTLPAIVHQQTPNMDSQDGQEECQSVVSDDLERPTSQSSRTGDANKTTTQDTHDILVEVLVHKEHL